MRLRVERKRLRERRPARWHLQRTAAAADLVAQPSFNIRAKTHRQVLTNVLWNCACAQIRQENSTFFHNPFNPHEHSESANQRSARADFAGALLVHNGKQLKNFNAVWEATKDRKNAGLFRPEAELLAMVQRTAADQLMVGGKVEFTDPDLCADVRKSPDFLLDPEVSKGGKVVVVAVNDPDQPGCQITSSLAGWLKGQNGRKAAESNPYALPPEAPASGETLNA